jgi:hypothetical protein
VSETIQAKKLTLRAYPPADGCEHMLDWEAAPVGQTRDSDPLTRANFDALCDRLDTADPYGKDWDYVRWPHWKCGWNEVIFVRPESECARIAGDVREQMKTYPCLDEGLWGKYEAMEESLKKESGNHD